MTEKEVLLHMIKNTKKNISPNCLNIKCINCYYLTDKCKHRCDYALTYNTKIPEELYIEKYGYISLIEELL